MSNAGFRIYTQIDRPARELVDKFSGLPVANIADEMNRFGCMDARIRPINATPLLGVAFTVKVRIGDNLMFHKALDLAQPGDVIVVDGRGDLANSLAGEIMMRQALKKGLAGIVVDGAVRDLAALQKMKLAIYAAGVTPQGPYKDGPGEINVPVSCGGVAVNPGDILVGDADGIVVIAPGDAQALASRAAIKSQKEQAIFKAIDAGTHDRSAYTDEAFRKRGCDIIEGTWRGR